MNTSQYLLTYYGLYEPTTIYMNILRSVWTHYDLYEHTKIHMNIQRSVWLYYGSPSLWLYYDMYEHPTISMNNPLPELLLRPPFVTSASTDKSNCFQFERRILEVAANWWKFTSGQIETTAVLPNDPSCDCTVAKWRKQFKLPIGWIAVKTWSNSIFLSVNARYLEEITVLSSSARLVFAIQFVGFYLARTQWADVRLVNNYVDGF